MTNNNYSTQKIPSQADIIKNFYARRTNVRLTCVEPVRKIDQRTAAQNLYDLVSQALANYEPSQAEITSLVDAGMVATLSFVVAGDQLQVQLIATIGGQAVFSSNPVTFAQRIDGIWQRSISFSQFFVWQQETSRALYNHI